MLNIHEKTKSKKSSLPAKTKELDQQKNLSGDTLLDDLEDEDLAEDI